jgi:tetratricopeptide (TPR) repeat protein
MILINNKYIKLLAVLLFSSLWMGIQAQNTDDEKQSKLAMNTFLDAEKNKMLENYPEAIKLYEKTLTIDDEYDPAMFELGRLYLYEQKYNEALLWVERAYKLDPTNKWYALLLIDLYRNNYQIADAINVYQTLLEEEPTNTEYLFSLSGLYHSIDDYENAILSLEKIEKLDGIGEKTSFQKRAIYLQAKDFDKALACMTELSNAYPEEEKYCSMIAEMYMQNKQPEEALVWYEKVLKINPENPYIQITLADYYSKHGDLEKAYEFLKEGYANPNLDIDTKIQVLVSYFEASNTNAIMKPRAFELAEILVKTHPEEPKSHAIYGDLLFRDSLYTEASQEFVRVIELDSTRYAVWEQLLYSLSMLNDNQGMADYSERAIGLFPEMEFPYYVNAIANFQLGKTKKVISVLEKGLYFVSNDQLLEQFYMFLGDAYHENDQKKKAYESYENCLKINPDNTFVLNNYAYYLSMENSQLEKAKTMAARAAEKDPNANNLDTYGWVLFQLGEYKDAQKYIQQSIDMDTTSSSVVLEHMGDVYYKLNNTKKAKSFWKQAKKAGGDSELLMKKIKEGKWYEK